MSFSERKGSFLFYFTNHLSNPHHYCEYNPFQLSNNLANHSHWLLHLPSSDCSYLLPVVLLRLWQLITEEDTVVGKGYLSWLRIGASSYQSPRHKYTIVVRDKSYVVKGG